MMKKLLSLLLLSPLLFCPFQVKADGLDLNTTSTPSPASDSTDSSTSQNSISGISGYNKFSNEVERQEVKSGNEKQSNVLPLTVTLLATGGVGGSYFFYQTKMKRR